MDIVEENWFLVVIIDPLGLPGVSLFESINFLFKPYGFEYVVFDDIHGARISEFVEIENTVCKMDKLLKMLPEVKQFDWGDFFFFKDYPKDFILNPEMQYPEIILQTDTTLRAVDDQYLYIYTPFEKIVNLAKAKYQIDYIKKDKLENFDYPF